jgi:hypothetical protein
MNRQKEMKFVAILRWSAYVLFDVVIVAELNEFVNSFSPWYIGFSSGGIPNKTRWIFSRIEQSS